MMEELRNIIESLLFAADAPLTLEQFKKVLPNAVSKDIRNALQSLADEYETRKGGFYLREVAGGYQICSRPEYREWIKLMIKPRQVRLSKAALETLAIIAYRQPIIRSDVEHIRGVDSGGVIRMLFERKMVRVLGRKDIPGRPLIYTTTKHFLEVFDLKDLKDLPTPKEIEDLTDISLEDEDLESLNHPVPETEQDGPALGVDAPAETESDAQITETEFDTSAPEAEPDIPIIGTGADIPAIRSEPDDGENNRDGDGDEQK